MLWALIRIALDDSNEHQGDSNAYPHHLLLWRTIANYHLNYHQIPSLSVLNLCNSYRDG